MKEVKLELYSVQIPVTTFVLAENQINAINEVTKIWEEQLPGVYFPNSVPCQWTGDNTNIIVTKDPDISGFNGNVYYDDDRFGRGYEISLLEAKYGVTLSESMSTIEEIDSEIRSLKSKLNFLNKVKKNLNKPKTSGKTNG
jgi:hypothetical protein